MSSIHASSTPLKDMSLTPAPYVMTPATLHETAPKIDLSKVLYIIPTPYKAEVWHHTLIEAKRLSDFPNLMHDISHSSPIGNPPPLSSIFLPNNLSSATLHPEIIDQELCSEVLSGCMSGPFSVLQAFTIFGGFFCSSPVGLVENV